MATRRRSRKSKSGYVRPKVRISRGTVTFGKRSPYKGKVTRANPSRTRRNPSAARGVKNVVLGTVLPLVAGLAGGVAITNYGLNKIGLFTSGWGLKLRGLVHIAVGALAYGYMKKDLAKKVALGVAASGGMDLVRQNVPGFTGLVGENQRYRMVGSDLPAGSIRRNLGADLPARSIQNTLSGRSGTTDGFFQAN
jgi:hypothetical protein